MSTSSCLGISGQDPAPSTQKMSVQSGCGMQTLLEEEQQRSRLLRQELADAQELRAVMDRDGDVSSQQADRAITSQVHSFDYLDSCWNPPNPSKCAA